MSRNRPAPPRVFISYSRSDAEWVEAFARDLRRVLKEEGVGAQLFRDDAIETGELWVSRLQEEVSRASLLVLVATPRALASTWVMRREVGALLTRPKARVATVRFADTPRGLSVWLDQAQAVEMAEPADYEPGVLAIAKMAIEPRIPRVTALSSPASGYDPPRLPASAWPEPGLRQRAVQALARFAKDESTFGLLCKWTGLDSEAFEALPSPELRASAAMLARCGGDGEPDIARKLLQRAGNELCNLGLAAVATPAFEVAAEIERALALALAQAAGLQAQRQGEDALQEYLSEVVRVQREHCTATGATSLAALQEVYVELSVCAEPERAGAEDLAAGLAAGRGLTLRGLLQYEQRRKEPTRRWLLRGDPGSGKTTALRHLALTLAEEAHGPGAALDAWVPVYLPLRELDAASGLDALGMAASLVPGRAEPTRRALEAAGAQGRLLLLLDGLDELDCERGVQRRVARLAERWAGRSAVVVSSRFIPERHPVAAGDRRRLAFGTADLRPFDAEQRRRFLEQWCLPGNPPLGQDGATRDWTAEAAWEEIDGRPALARLAEVPLLLTLLAEQRDRGQPFSTHRMDLYRDAIRGRFTKAYRFSMGQSPLPPDCVDELIAVLAAVAFALTEENRDDIAYAELERLLLRGAAQTSWELVERLAPWGDERHGRIGAFLRYISQQTGLLRPRRGEPEGQQARWEFDLHRTYREALTALRLAQWPAQELLGFAGRHRQPDSAWTEPLVMAVGALSPQDGHDPDALVLELIRSNARVGYRALGTARNLKPETLTAALKLDSGGLEARRKAIHQVPELVEDPEAARDVLLRLVDDPAAFDANDVFFVHEALERLRQRPEGAPIVDGALALLYGRLPPVPEGDLFERIAVPDQDGRAVDLWHEVPPGTEFWMGSPEDEEGRRDNEGPRHRVRLTRGFRVMVVPATNAMFQAFCPAFRPERWRDKGASRAELEHHPAVNITWYMASSFCEWLARRGPDALRGARLPTEAEWECVARAGTEKAYYSGDGKSALAEVGWYGGNAEGRTHRVGGKRFNPWGLYDVHGNVWEWTADWWKRDYQATAQREALTNPKGAESGDFRVVRGGSWLISARWCRAAYRDYRRPGDRHRHRGFRVVASAAPEL